MMLKSDRTLVIAPHTDDAELGCGGSIARLIEQGTHVHVAVFSTAQESLPQGYQPDTLKKEFLCAMELLGVDQANLFVYDFTVRRLSDSRQQVLDTLVKLRSNINPDLVMIPSEQDVHQDHQVVFAEGVRAFKDSTVLGYELPWNHFTFSSQAFVVLEERHLEAKWRALQCYATQMELNRPYFSLEFMRGLAIVRGVQVKTRYAECFEVIRLKC